MILISEMIMPKFSQTSLKRLATCHEDLQKLFMVVIDTFDCTIIEGERKKELQDKAFAEGKSKLKYPNSKHNSYPSMAVDAAPYRDGINWGNTEKDKQDIILFAGFVLGVAKELKLQNFIEHEIRWGGDWNSNFTVTDETFEDLFHFELVKNYESNKKSN